MIVVISLGSKVGFNCALSFITFDSSPALIGHLIGYSKVCKNITRTILNWTGEGGSDVTPTPTEELPQEQVKRKADKLKR